MATIYIYCWLQPHYHRKDSWKSINVFQISTICPKSLSVDKGIFSIMFSLLPTHFQLDWDLVTRQHLNAFKTRNSLVNRTVCVEGHCHAWGYHLHCHREKIKHRPQNIINIHGSISMFVFSRIMFGWNFSSFFLIITDGFVTKEASSQNKTVLYLVGSFWPIPWPFRAY